MKRLWNSSLVVKIFLSYFVVVALLFLSFYFSANVLLRHFYIRSLSTRMEQEAHLLARMVPFDQAGAALDLVNRHPFGNGAGLFTRDGEAARDFSDKVQAGMVGVNVPIPVPVGYHSFGGWKRSLFGSHGVYGPEAVHFYTRLKTVTARWSGQSGAGFSFPGN